MTTWPLETIDENTFIDLCNALDSALHLRQLPDGSTTWDCDHTLTKTRWWIEHHTSLNADHVLEEFRYLGGFCDCEVLLNVMSVVREDGEEYEDEEDDEEGASDGLHF
jgi:uncharacterized protein DUF2695